MNPTKDRIWMALAIALAMGLTMSLVLSQQGGVTAVAAEKAAPAAGDATAASDNAIHTVEISLSEFSISPAEISVPSGVPLRFEVTNTGVAPHDFTIEGVTGTEQMQAGGTTALEVEPLEPGTYTVLCTVAGHEAAGMTAILTVTEGEPVVAEAEHADHTTEEADHAVMSPEEMARMHDEGVAAFPVETQGRGNQLMEPEVLADGTKVFELTADEIEWETKPGEIKQAMAYNGQVPGPQIRVDLGDNIRIVVHNELEEPTALHSHGLILPNEMDGVPGLTQSSILPGESFTYEFTVRNAGSHMYHSHFNSAEQVTKGLLGALVVEDPDTDPDVDHDYVLIANDGPLGYTLNGKDFPATQPFVVKEGDVIRMRYMNEGLQVHPMHLHGIPQKVIAKDGYMLPQPHFEDTVLVAPGERVDVLIEATELGAWAFHCHILTHAEGPEGMFGMVTALIVEG